MEQRSVDFANVVEAETRVEVDRLKLINDKGKIDIHAVRDFSANVLQSLLNEQTSSDPDAVRILDSAGKTPRLNVFNVSNVVQMTLTAIFQARNGSDAAPSSGVVKKEKGGRESTRATGPRDSWENAVDPDGDFDEPVSATTGHALSRIAYKIGVKR